jgi:Domain of unknown function (DUF4834)
MARYIFYALVVYLLYRLIFGFIIPIFRTSKKMREQFNQARQQMEDQYQQTGQQNEDAGRHNAPKGSSKIGEYIDFEEIRK